MEFSAQDDWTVALAVMLTTVAGQVTLRPVLGLVTAESAIAPAKLLLLVSETETEAPVAPELKLTEVPTEILKSPTWTRTVV